MRLLSVRVSNFRAIRQMNLQLESQVTVIVGRNGAGKTTLLEAISKSLKQLRMYWPDSSGKTKFYPHEISQKDISEGESECFVKVNYILDELAKDSVKSLKSMLPEQGPQFDEDSPHKLLQEMRNGRKLPLRPCLFVYYHQDRGFRGGGKSNDVLNQDEMRNVSLTPDLRAINDLQTWWDRRDAQEAREVRDVDQNYRDPQLEAIRHLIKQIDSFFSISYLATAKNPGLHLRKRSGEVVHVNDLSSGERSYIILLADLARRLQVSEPDKSPDQIKGIVLIDEIELNLHPAWQSEIVPSLMKHFPMCQFIVTTHSPQVISSVPHDNVRILESSESGSISVTTPLSTKGRTSNYLLEGVFGASERNPGTKDLIDRFNMAIEDSKLTEAESLFVEICSELEGDSADLILFKKRLNRLKAQQ